MSHSTGVTLQETGVTPGAPKSSLSWQKLPAQSSWPSCRPGGGFGRIWDMCRWHRRAAHQGWHLQSPNFHTKSHPQPLLQSLSISDFSPLRAKISGQTCKNSPSRKQRVGRGRWGAWRGAGSRDGAEGRVQEAAAGCQSPLPGPGAALGWFPWHFPAAAPSGCSQGCD